MSETIPDPGELNYEPATGAEARKRRPSLVLAAPEFLNRPVRIVVPLTTWQPRFERHLNKVPVARTDANGLALDWAADVLPLRSVSTERFDERIGALEGARLLEVMGTLLLVVGFRSPPGT